MRSKQVGNQTRDRQFVQANRLRNIPVVKPKSKTNNSSGFRKFGPPVLLFFALVVQLSVRLECLDLSYRMEDSRAEVLKRDVEIRQLRLEYAYFSRPGILGVKARDRLAMLPLPPQHIRKINQI